MEPTEPTTLVSVADPEDRPRARLFEGEPRTVRLSLAAGERVPPHRHPERLVVLHLLDGRLSMTLDDEEHVLEAGEMIRFDGKREVSPAAIEDSTAVLVLAARA